MSDQNQDMSNSNGGLADTLSGQLAVAALFFLFIIFLTSLVIYLRAKGYAGTATNSAPTRISTQHDPSTTKCALDPSILNSLPITTFQSNKYEDGCSIECAVCICELRNGEQVRFLPKCNHGFHVECIDMWFSSNNTCPLCRKKIDASSELVEVVSEIGSSSSSMLVIDIPKQNMHGFDTTSSPLPKSRFVKVTSPVTERMGSFKRMMSRVSFKMMGSSPCYSPTESDVEHGLVSEQR